MSVVNNHQLSRLEWLKAVCEQDRMNKDMERINKIDKDMKWQSTNPISNLAKKALFTMAQIYRAIPYGIISFVNWITRYNFEVIKESKFKHKEILNALRELKAFSPQLRWFTKKYDKDDYEKAMGRGSAYLKKIISDDNSEKEIVVIEGVFDAMMFSGPKVD